MKSGLVLVLLGTVFTLGTPAVAEDPNFCQETAQLALRSCQAGARSDYLLALGKCDNISDPAGRTACRQQAFVDSKESLSKCDSQFSARQAACQRLGGQPYDPPIDPANFVDKIDNPYFPLVPGTTYTYEGKTAEGIEHEEFTVTRNTRVILDVTCVEVRDTVRMNGELTEDTLDWFAQDKERNVWYFGENAKQLSDGLIVGLEGSWTAGVDGAKPGIIMEAHPAAGDFYRQEFLLDTAEDVARVVSLDQSVTVPAGSYKDCLETRDTSTLEPDVVELKFYAPGVGNVLEVDPSTGERLKLIQIVKR